LDGRMGAFLLLKLIDPRKTRAELNLGVSAAFNTLCPLLFLPLVSTDIYSRKHQFAIQIAF
jgi:hypothetical protein